MNAAAMNSGVYTDFGGLQALRADARDADANTLREVAGQFESIFVQMMLKSMRQASFGDPLFDSNQSGFYRDMFDQQISLQMGREPGIGLADVIMRQMGGAEMTAPPEPASPFDRPPTLEAGPVLPAATPEHVESLKLSFVDALDFRDRLMPHARTAGEALGVLPEVLVAQAALETGWGKHVMPRANGDSSFNLFGIKSGSDWQGQRVQQHSLEFEDGIAQRRLSSFRAYDSIAASFEDYTQFLKNRVRYQGAVEQATDPQAYLHGLQEAGYATDPRYAEKILAILERQWPNLARLGADQTRLAAHATTGTKEN